MCLAVLADVKIVFDLIEFVLFLCLACLHSFFLYLFFLLSLSSSLLFSSIYQMKSKCSPPLSLFTCVYYVFTCRYYFLILFYFYALCVCVCCVCGVHNTTTIIIIIIMYDFGVMLRETLLRVVCLYPVVVHNPFVLSFNLV